ncbi:MAG: efflux RND transporter permease subunit [Nostoc sp.]|uniref:efflux RND transporter permease subunit n=1 Tax=Nostoc sp. TaxID=1180 RepID=UPI002FFA07C2
MKMGFVGLNLSVTQQSPLQLFFKHCQIGLVMLIGLASKNAILIVEFANQLPEQRLSITKAVIEASQERLRPILITVFSWGYLRWLLLQVLAREVGNFREQQYLGGMLIATFLSLFVVPIKLRAVKQRAILPSTSPRLRSATTCLLPNSTNRRGAEDTEKREKWFISAILDH